MEFGTGRTTRQMERLKKDGVFVWLNSETNYPKMIARKIDRPDIQVKPLHWFRLENICGRLFSDVELDHSILDMRLLNEDGFKAYERINAYVCRL